MEWIRSLQPETDQQDPDDLPGLSQLHTSRRRQVDSGRAVRSCEGPSAIRGHPLLQLSWRQANPIRYISTAFVSTSARRPIHGQ